MAGYFAADRPIVNQLEGKMANRKGYDGEEPKSEMKGAKEGELRFDKKEGKKDGHRKHSRKSSRK